MWEPVGPLPATVYWRRRCSAALATVAVLGLLTWTAVSVATPETTTRAASRAAVSAPQPAAPPPVPAATPTSPPGAGSAPGSSPASVTAEPGQPAPGQPADAGERLRPDDSPRAAALPAPPPIPVPTAAPVPCSDDMLAVSAEITPGQHQVGQRPTLRLVVTNVSKQPCVRDLDSARQEIVVWSPDGQRLWSSNDCVNGSAPDRRTLVPAQPVAFAVVWAGRTSTPGCGGARTVLPAGDYQLRTRVDDVTSGPADFRRLP